MLVSIVELSKWYNVIDLGIFPDINAHTMRNFPNQIENIKGKKINLGPYWFRYMYFPRQMHTPCATFLIKLKIWKKKKN